ncbi:MAG: hypothetical protein ACREBR_04085, partial [bacterium]
NSYTAQKNGGANVNLHPRGPQVTKLLNSLSRESYQKSRTSFADRGVGKMEFSDLSCIDLDNEGHGECKAVLAVLGQGKTNQLFKQQYGACLRNKDVQICPVGSIAMYFFWRFEVDREGYPDFAESRNWHNCKVIRGCPTDAMQEFSYKSHYDAIADAFKKAGIVGKAKTHAGRSGSVRIAELGGCDEDSLRRFGRWNAQAMEGCYLSQLAREPMRVLAGFGPKTRTYFIPRDTVQPSESLLSKVFPPVTRLLEEEANRGTPNIAAIGFLRLLLYLRKVLLQDAVQLQVHYPNHPLWRHEVFQSQEFLDFKQQLLSVTEHTETPAEV